MLFKIARGITATPFVLGWWVVKGAWLGARGVWKVNTAFYTHMLMKKPEPTHGNAHFASWKELKKTIHAEPNGWYVGRVENKRVFTDPESCVIGVAPRRTGKSNMAKSQAIAQAKRAAKPDLIVFDPHGDIRPAVLQTFLDEGYEEQFLNFTDPLNSHHYNPVSAVRTNGMYQQSDSDQFMKLVMAAEKGHNAHFTNFPRLVMAGFIAFMQRVAPERAFISNVVELMVADKSKREQYFKLMEKQGGPVERAGVTAFQDAGERERGSFGTTMAWKLAPWLRPAFRHITGQDGFTWQDNFLNPKPVVTFITTGASNIEGAAARLIIGNAINTRVQMWPRIVATHRGKGAPRFPKELRILVDEARLLENCEAIVTAVTEGGKMGISLMMWVLGIDDLDSIYPEASVIKNSSNFIVFGGGTEMGSYEAVSRMIGDKTIESKAMSEGKHGASLSRSEQAQRLAKPEWLRTLPKDELVAILGPTVIHGKKPYTFKNGELILL